MTAFSLDPAQTAWCEELRTLAEQQLRPLAEKGAPGHVNRPLIAALGETGLLDRLLSSGALDLCLLRESLARGCTEAETALALQGLGTHPCSGRAPRPTANAGSPRCGPAAPSPPSRSANRARAPTRRPSP